MKRSRLSSRGIARIILGGIGIGFFFNLLRKLPVYPDEEQWLFVNSRQLIDSQMQYLFPVCQDGFLLNQPILWAPIRWLNWLVYSHSSLIVNLRVVGLIQAFLFVCIYWKFLDGFSRDSKQSKIIAFGVFCSGLIPFLLILNRPEQQLMLLFFGALNVSLRLKNSNSLLSKLAFGSIFTLLVISMPAIHPKGALFSLAASTISLLVGNKKSLWLNFLAAIAGIISSISSVNIWSTRTSCEQSGFLSTIFQTITINPTELHSGSMRMILGNLIRTPKYLLNIFYQESYQSNWLAQESPISFLLQLMANVAMITMAVFVFTILSHYFFTLLKKREKFSQVDYVSLTMIAIFGILTTLQRTKNFYDSYLPILLLLSAAIIVQKEKSIIATGKLKKFQLIIIVLSLPAFLWTNSNFVKSDPQQEKSTYTSLIQDCEITDNQLSRGGFIIDGSLTKYFWASPNFIYSNYVWGWWAQDVDADKLIKKLKPPVIIVRNDGTLGKETYDSIVGDFLCRNFDR